MIETVIEFSRYYAALIFGTSVAASFAGMARTRKNYLALVFFTVTLFMLQVICLRLWGMEIAI